jgi:FAD/FMN-containing dehydrogenase
MTTTGTIELAGLDGGHHTLTSEQLEDLGSRVQGRLLVAGDQGWNEAVAIWNGMAARLPALVLQPASAHDVAAAVGLAREHGLLLSVKGGGHNIAGTSIAEGGLTLDLSGMREVSVDPQAMLAQVGPGCLLGEVDQATQAHGLATVLGFVSETGVAGLATRRPADPHVAWARAGWERIRPFSTGGNYVNFQLADDDTARTAAAYGNNYRRLQRAKATYDPGNLFRVSRNIPPAA